jgi:hypothetical protein
MPEISRFFGILIRMYFDDHNPRHFHAIYAGNEAEIAIEPIEVVEVKLPARAASMVFEWAALHQRELLTIGTACTTSSRPRGLGLWIRRLLCSHA